MKTIKLKYADQAKEYFPNMLGKIVAAMLEAKGEYCCLIDGVKTKIIIERKN